MTLKILLVGFSTLSATALIALLQRNYPQVECVMLSRCFSDDLHLMLPKLGSNADDAYGLIINLEGVGMSTFNPDHIRSLIHFIDFRAVLLLARNDINEWRQANFIPKSSGSFLQTPYTKEVMEVALAEFIELTTYLQANPSESAKNHDKLRTYAAKYLEVHHDFDELGKDNPRFESSSDTSNTHENEGVTTKDDFLQTVVNTCFSGVCQNNVMHDLMNIYLSGQPFKIGAGAQTAYVHPKKNLALVANLDRLLDYFSVAGNCQVLKNSIVTQTIADNEFNGFLDNLHNDGYHRHSLSAFLWQIYSAILPAKINVPKNNLKLKIRYMPDLGSMQNVPEYIHAILSSCLITPKSIDELEEMFAETIKYHPTILQRILLLSILSDLADINILKRSFDEVHNNQEMSNPETAKSINQEEKEFAFTQATHSNEMTPNKSVVQAAKTGFFKRLLSKLSF